MNYKARLDKLSEQLPADERIITIVRLALNEEEAQAPVTYRRGTGGRLIKRVGIDTVPTHLRAPRVNVRWTDYEIDTG